MTDSKALAQYEFGSTGRKTAPLGLGCMGMTFAYGPSNTSEAVELIRRAVDMGVTLVDTADMYGPYTNEVLVGKALGAMRREQVILSSKVGSTIDDEGRLTMGIDCSPAYIRRSIDGTLRRLGVDRLDLYYLHRIDPTVPIEESVGAMAELVAAGKIAHIGLCEASAATVARAHAEHPIAALQSEYSLLTRDVESNGVLDVVRERGIAFVAYSPLSRGLLTDSKRGVEQLADTDFRRIAPRFSDENRPANEELVAAVRRVANRLSRSTASVALAWVIAQGNVLTGGNLVALAGARKLAHLNENGAAAVEPLEPQDVAELSALVPQGATQGDRYPAGAMQYLDG
ncbi:aldo/keto reductase [Nocardia sp. BSTN01]|uniref:aldo/keto reductase n=1 Tax=Nocardia sp. BSTN01 TaxID=2783665 RepID=UPI00188E1283|nr:aldo/keto reductase [Nocardia sp. BSTN01]MBF5002399.1 aldo/keto reductase [Nocardia sp. BSTN01]